MFRPLGGVLKKREQELQAHQRGARSISHVISRILEEYELPNSVNGIRISHSESRREVIIDTPSKSMAHQLIMHSLEIKSLIKEEGFSITSLIIR